mmetsp:Transcript_52589/g.153282  ORF Transcript_52589/g.153282 Transcript_52589/m.153282 type:complete len:297 (-) Transcript_52589:2618-3508(-)
MGKSSIFSRNLSTSSFGLKTPFSSGRLCSSSLSSPRSRASPISSPMACGTSSQKRCGATAAPSLPPLTPSSHREYSSLMRRRRALFFAAFDARAGCSAWSPSSPELSSEEDSSSRGASASPSPSPSSSRSFLCGWLTEASAMTRRIAPCFDQRFCTVALTPSPSSPRRFPKAVSMPPWTLRLWGSLKTIRSPLAGSSLMLFNRSRVDSASNPCHRSVEPLTFVSLLPTSTRELAASPSLFNSATKNSTFSSSTRISSFVMSLWKASRVGYSTWIAGFFLSASAWAAAMSCLPTVSE